MPRYVKVTKQEQKALKDAEARYGSRMLRTLLVTDTGGRKNPRIVSRLRLARLSGGSGKLSEAEAERLSLIRSNTTQIKRMVTGGGKQGKKDFQTSRAIRQWLTYGKQRGADNEGDFVEAIKALRYLGLNPEVDAPYLKGIT